MPLKMPVILGLSAAATEQVFSGLVPLVTSRPKRCPRVPESLRPAVRPRQPNSTGVGIGHAGKVGYTGGAGKVGRGHGVLGASHCPPSQIAGVSHLNHRPVQLVPALLPLLSWTL